MYPKFEFIEGELSEVHLGNRLFDVVVVNAWFSQVTNWKDFLKLLSSYSRRYIIISINFRLEGTTVIDPDVSFFYYLDSGVRVPEITHNMYEFLNYASTHEIGAKEIHFYGYSLAEKNSATFRPLPRSKVIQGNCLIEKFPEGENLFTRIGGFSNEASKFLPNEMQFFKPEYHIIINDEKITF
jgi:hypothetical protein